MESGESMENKEVKEEKKEKAGVKVKVKKPRMRYEEITRIPNPDPWYSYIWVKLGFNIIHHTQS